MDKFKNLTALAPLGATTPEFIPAQLLLKATTVANALDIGRTLLRELHTPSHQNFDPTFPQPITITKGGPDFFLADELFAWVIQRAQTYRAALLNAEPRRGARSKKCVQADAKAQIPRTPSCAQVTTASNDPKFEHPTIGSGQ